jgi:DNA-binding transcriptional LysR family regulator
MDVRNLAAFVEVVRSGGFSRASSVLHLTQSAVSKAVKAIEEELGQPLLVRLGRRVTLTDAGRVVFERAQAVLSVLHAIEEEVAEVGAVRRGHLRLGIPPMVGAAFFPPVLGDFRTAYPGVVLDLREVAPSAPRRSCSRERSRRAPRSSRRTAARSRCCRSCATSSAPCSTRGARSPAGGP